MNKKLIPVGLILTIVSLACNLVTSSIVSDKSSGEGIPTPSSSSEAGPTVAPSASAQAQGITAAATGESLVDLSWEPISGASKYLLEIQLGDQFMPIAVLPASQTAYQDENLPPATRFTYRLSNLVNGEKRDSKEISVETLPETIDPMQVAVTFDTASPLLSMDPDNFDPGMFMAQPVEAEVIIGPQGGEISVTGSNGVLYRLTVPPNALRMEVPIKLKPISAIADLPLSGGLMAGVYIEPDTMVFDVPAQLEMIPPADFPAALAPLLLAFSFESQGQEFHLYPLLADAEQSRVSRMVASPNFIPNLAGPLADIMELQNAGGYGQASGTVEDVKKISKRAPAKSQNRTTQRVATTQLDELTPIPKILDDLAPLKSMDQLKDMQFAKMAVSILQKAINANDWGKFMEAVDDFSVYINADGDTHHPELNDLIFDMLATKAQGLLQKNKGDCLTYEDYAAQDLVERLSNPKDTFSLLFATRFKAKYGQKLLDDIAFGMKNCKFELTMTSKLTYAAEDSKLTTYANISQPIPLFMIYSKGEMFLWGGGPMELSDQVSGACNYPLSHYPTLTFMVEKLSPVFQDGVLVDFKLSGYSVRGWTHAVSIKASEDKRGCPTMIALKGGGDFWTGIFVLARQESKIIDWKLSNKLTNEGRLTADWVSDIPSFTPAGVSGIMTEDTKFQLKVTKNKK